MDGIFAPFFEDEDTELVETIDRYRDHNEGEQVGRRDDGRHYHNEHQGISPVPAQHVGVDKAHLAKHERKHGQLEHYAHHECERGEGSDVRIEGDGVYYLAVDLIGSQKLEGYREKDEIAHQQPDDEEKIYNRRYEIRIFLLALIKCRRHKAKELEQDIRRRKQTCQYARHRNVRHELRRQFGVYQRYVILRELKVPPALVQQRLDERKSAEIALVGSEKYGKSLFLKAEYHRGQDHDHTEDAEKHSAQHVEMAAEGIQSFPRRITH